MLKLHYFPLKISMCHSAEIQTTYFPCALTMSSICATKRNLREALLFCFNLNKSAADRHRLLCETYGEHAS